MRIGGIKKWVGCTGMPGRHEPAPAALQVAASGALPGIGAGEPAVRGRRWPLARIAAVEALWGTGYTGPGSPAETMRLAKPMGLTKDATLLLLGGGLGGPADAIGTALGAWVDSFEADPELSAIAEQRRTTSHAAKHIKVQDWDRANPGFKQKSANHALSLEAMRGAPPEPILVSMAGALRPHGHIVITELVTDVPAPPQDREFAAWCRLENREPQLPPAAAVTKLLTRLRFDVRVVEDLSDRHVTATLGGWRAAVKAMEAGPRPDPAAAGVFVTEAELWLLRIRLMRRLGLRLLRWHAIGSA